MAEQLGTAELQLDTDQAPLIRGLAEAEARVAKSVAVMQAMMDKLHADVEHSDWLVGHACCEGRVGWHGSGFCYSRTGFNCERGSWE